MILVINICNEKLHELEFVKPVESILLDSHEKFETKHYSEVKDSDLKKAGKVIICGTSLKDNKFIEDFYRFEWIKKFKKPILGICGGSHLIGLSLGYPLKKKKEVGLKEINLKKEFLGIKGKIQVYHLHQFYSLPGVFHKKNFYAVLFHPEVRNREIVENFVKIKK